MVVVREWLGYGCILKVELIGFDDGLVVVYDTRNQNGSRVLVGPNSNNGVTTYGEE